MTDTISVYFDCNSIHWKNVPEYNLMFLRQTENYCHNQLLIRGHLFLNEVFDELGIKRTVEGQKMGWLSITGTEKVDFHFDKNLDSVFDGDGRLLLQFDVDEIIEEI